MFENVLGLLSARDEDGTLHFDNMRALFQKCGYSTEFRSLNASDYGVLQNRKRIILIGTRGEHAGFYPEIPVVQNHFLVNEVFGDLPAIAAGGGTTEPVATAHYGGEYLYESGIKEYDTEPVTFHQARPHTEQDLEIYRIVVDTWNRTGTRVSYIDLPANLRTHQNMDSFLDRFKVVAGNLPYAQTIVAHIARDGHYFIHPDIEQNRSITPREAARIQTFPDNYYFESKKGIPSRTLAYSLGVSMADGPGHILGDGSALLFGKGTHQRDEKFASAVHGVDVLPLKINRYPGGFQFADGREGIYGISGKTGQRFCEDQIDFTVQRIIHHAVETVPPADGQAGNAVIGVHSGKDPVRVLPDIFREILLLRLKTVLLGILHGGHSGISGDPLRGGRLGRRERFGGELNPCNLFLRQCCSPPIRQWGRCISLRQHGARPAHYFLKCAP